MKASQWISHKQRANFAQELRRWTSSQSIHYTESESKMEWQINDGAFGIDDERRIYFNIYW